MAAAAAATATAHDERPSPASTLRGARVLVTGGTGFLGTYVVRALLAAGSEVEITARRAHPTPPPERVRVHVGDLRDPAVRDRLVTPGLDGIVHLAAATSIPDSLRDPLTAYETNVGVTAALLDLARARGVRRFLLASTAAVVGNASADGSALDESTPLRPLSPYAATKAAGEMLLAGYSGGYGMTTCALRLTNVYGPGSSHSDTFIPRLLRAARSGETVRVNGDGLQSRDFVYGTDAARAFLAAWTAGVTGALVVGGGRSVSVLELVQAVREATGAELPVEHVPAPPGEMKAAVVDIGRARAAGYEPSVTLAEGLAATWRELA